jgi:histidine triad (HIT) family protein
LKGDLTGHEITAAAGIAVTAVSAVPADPDPLAPHPSGNAFADRVDDSGDFMPGNPRIPDARPLSFPGQGIAVADAASFDLYAHVSGSGLCDLAFSKFKGTAGMTDLHDSHLWHDVSPFDLKANGIALCQPVKSPPCSSTRKTLELILSRPDGCHAKGGYPFMTSKPCPFCQMALGEHPAQIVFEDDVSLAFLDHRPLFPGHLLLIPREHHATLGDLPPSLIGPLFANARLLSRAVEEGLEAEGSFVAVNNRVSQSVPHLHIHIVPRRRRDGLKGFFWPRHPYRDESEIRAVQLALRAAIARLRREEESSCARQKN